MIRTITDKLRFRMGQLKANLKLRKEYGAIFREFPNTVFLVMTPEHGNLGDHAIAYAETQLLTKLGINYIEITGDQLNDMRWSGVLYALDGYTILLQGGGYLGTLWYSAEEILRVLLQKTPHSKHLIFPNTIFYEDSQWGKDEFEKSRQIYNQHKNLHLLAREQYSYDIMHDAYENVTLIPDIVLSLNEYSGSRIRKGCLLCLRNDCEKTRTSEDEQLIRKQLEAYFAEEITDTDMVADHRISIEMRESELRAKFDEFSSSQLVVTDRLHAMIFSAITGTPCIVINSKSPKVRGTYEWIKYLPYIRFAESVDDVGEYIPELLKMENCQYDNTPLMPYYDKLAEIIKQQRHK